MLYYFVEFAGSFANIALLLLFIGRLFPKKEPVSRWFYAYVALLIAGQCALSLFPDWVTQRTIYLLVGGFFLALLFYEVRPWQAVFASGAFFTLIALVEVLAMLLIGLRIPDTDILMQAGAARLVYVVFSNLIQIPLVVLISHFFSRKGNALRILWLLPIIAIQIASIAVCYVAQYHAVDEYFPDYMVGLMAVLLLINILIVFYVEALRENELEKFKVKFNEQQYNLQMEYYQQLKERQEEVRSLRHDVKKYILAMQAVAEHGDTEELHKIAQAATDVFERSTNISAVGNPVVDALLNYYLRIAERNYIKVKLDVTIPEVLTISSLSLSIIIGNTFDNAIEACCDLPAEQRIIHLQLRKQYRSLFYRLENPYSDTVRSIRIGEYRGYGLKNINRIVQENHGDFYRLFVDESQNYKNLYLYTKMRNVAGLSTSEAQKSSDMFGKCRYLDEVTGGRGVIFATGTPISNSMTEMYTLMRYLQYSTLQQKQLTHFDAWASTFGETTTAIELAPEGTGYRARTRFAKFFNLPELMNMFKEAADIKTSDQLHLPVPEAKFETVVVKPSEIQQDMVKSLSERAAEVHSGAVDPSVDNMLKITSDGRKIGLDQRLMNPLTPDDPDSKLNACVDNVLRIWNETKEDNLTQLIFCDMSTPKGDGSFNVYDDIRTKLLAAGVPESEVEFIHNADTEGKKADLFSKVRSGKVRVLLGSTAKMGAGTNVQTLLVAVHHLDVGWRPSDMTQRNGRIIRQGNKNKQVYVYNYVTEGTFDAYLWQTLENKQKFISQIMTSKSPMRSCDDVDEQALSYAEVKALCAGDPRIREKMDLDVQVAKLKVLRSDYQNQKYRLEDKLLKHYPEEIQKAKNRIAALKNDAQIADAHPQDKENFCGMTIKGMVFDEKKAAGERLMLACKEMPNADMMLLGTYRGFELNIRFDSFKNEHQIVLRGELSYPVPLGDDPRGNIVRLDNAIGNFADRIADADAALDSLEQQKQAAEVEIAKPFAQEEELQTKSARLAELDALLNMEHQSSRTEPEAEEKPDARPSVLAALEEKADKVEPVRPFKSYLDKDGDAR